MKGHYHTRQCLDMENEDGGYSYYTCRVTGETHRTIGEFQIEEPDS